MSEVVELYVVMHCEACAASVKRAVKKIPGVQSYNIDYYEQKVTVIGDVDRKEVWRRIHKTGKRVTLIPKPAPPKEEPQDQEKKEETKEEKQEEEKKEVITTTEEKNQEQSEETKAVDTEEEVEAYQVVTVVETKEEEEKKKNDEVGAQEGSEQEEAKREGKKERPERLIWVEPEWVPTFVSAPFYTLPSTFF